MKKISYRKVLCLALVMLSMATTAQEVRTFSFNHEGKTGFRLTGQTKGNVSLEFNIDKLSLSSFKYNGEEMQSICIADISLPNEKGLPNVPSYSRMIAIPQGAEAVIHVTSYDKQNISNVNIEPSLGVQAEEAVPDMEYTKDMKVYAKNAFYPADFASVSTPSKLRGVDVVNVCVSPVQFNPVTKEAIVYHNIKIEVEFVGGTRQFGDDRLRSPYFDPILAQNIMNYNTLPIIDYSARMQQWLRDGDEGYEYLIVTPNNDGWAEPAARLKEYRKQQGILTAVMRLDEMGVSSINDMKTWFHNAYNTWDIPPVAVLLFGDYKTNMSMGIPAETISHPYSWTCITDNNYADVDGDFLPEMVFARLVAANASEAAMMVDKQIEYEYTNPNMDTLSYDTPVTALGWQTERWFQLCSEIVGGYFRQQGRNPRRINCIYDGVPGEIWSDADNTQQVVAYFGPNGTGYIPQTPDELGGFTGGTSEQIIQAINAGTMLIQHRDHGLEEGWGEPAFRNTHVAQLTNVGKMPFVMSINCLTGKFDNNTPCFAEAFMRHTYQGQNAGAVGLLCPTEVSYSFVNDAYVWGVYDHFEPDFMPSYGPYAIYESNWLPAFGNVAGKVFLSNSSWPYNYESKEITYQMFTAHCDAFLRLYTHVPHTMNVSHQSVQNAGLNTFQITAPAGTMIALTKGEGEQMEIVAVAEATGSVQTIDILPQMPPTMLKLTVTGQDYLRYEADIEVIPADGPYLIINSFVLSDEASQLNFGDNSGLDIQLKNVGNAIAPAGTMTLSSESDYVTITSNTVDIPEINSNEVLNIAEAFSFSISDFVPNKTKIDFTIVITSGSDIYENHINIKAYAPTFEIGNVIINEIEGNGNGRLDPGETVNLKFPIHNKGNADSRVTNSSLAIDNSYMNLLSSSTVAFETIAAGETLYAEYMVYIGDAPSGFQAVYTLSVESGVYTDTREFVSKIGLNIEDFESGAINHSLWSNDHNHPWLITTESPYEGQYCVRSGQIGDSQETILTLMIDTEEADSVAFYYKVSSENSYDKLYFYIDNVEKANWSGTINWTKAEYAVTQGIHTLKWSYEKDYSVSNGSDCAWIDYVVLPRERSMEVEAGQDILICADENAQLNGSATHHTSLEWSTLGDGTFNNATLMNAIYTPGTQDIENGGTYLILTAFKNLATVQDTLALSFISEPVVVCADVIETTSYDPIVIPIEIENMGSFIGWTTSGSGQFTDSYTLQTTYIPSEEDYDNEQITITADYTGCGYKTYQQEIVIRFILLNVAENNATTLTIHPNPTENVINISIGNLTSDVQITIFNNIGQIVYSQKDTADDGFHSIINLNDFPSGTYILQVRSDEDIWTERIIKK